MNVHLSGYLLKLTPRSGLIASKNVNPPDRLSPALQKGWSQGHLWVCPGHHVLTSTGHYFTHLPAHPAFHNRMSTFALIWTLCRTWTVAYVDKTAGLSLAVLAWVLIISFTHKLEIEDSLFVRESQTLLNKWKKWLGIQEESKLLAKCVLRDIHT